MKPIIGITCNFDNTGAVAIASGMGLPEQKFHHVADDYAKAVEKAGGIPILIPLCSDFETVKQMLNIVNGVILSGGNDIAPTIYGDVYTKECGTIVPERDAQDIAAAQYIIKDTKLPLLGICRGMQVMNVSMGGTLYTDLVLAGKILHSIKGTPTTLPVHEVVFDKGSKVADIFELDKMGTNSYHHLGVKDVAKGFVITGTCPLDGTAEAMEMPGERMVVGVQWHPEMMRNCDVNARIFKYLIKEASRS